MGSGRLWPWLPSARFSCKPNPQTWLQCEAQCLALPLCFITACCCPLFLCLVLMSPPGPPPQTWTKPQLIHAIIWQRHSILCLLRNLDLLSASNMEHRKQQGRITERVLDMEDCDVALAPLLQDEHVQLFLLGDAERFGTLHDELAELLRADCHARFWDLCEDQRWLLGEAALLAEEAASPLPQAIKDLLQREMSQGYWKVQNVQKKSQVGVQLLC